MAEPYNAPPPDQIDLLEKVLPLILQLCLSGAMKVLMPAAESESHKLAFKLYNLANFVNFTLVVVLVVHLVALLIGAMQPPISNMVKCIMWVTVAMSYFTFAFGTILNFVA